MKRKNLLKRVLSLLTSAALLVPMTVSAAETDAGTETAAEVEVNFAKALQLSMYFYDANKCGPGITGGNLEWRGDCHVEDAAVPLIPMGEDFKGTNLSQEFIEVSNLLLSIDYYKNAPG